MKNRNRSLSKRQEEIKGRCNEGFVAPKATEQFARRIRLCSAFLVVSLLFAAFLTVSCTDEVSSSGDSLTDAVIRLTIRAKSPENASTRSVDEDQIHDLHVLVYNSSGDLTGKNYSTFDASASSYSVTVNARSGDGCTIYAIANTDNAALFDGAVANTEDKLKTITTSSAAWDDLNNSSSTTTYLPMSGSIPANISAGATVLDGGITVKRLVAKVTLNVGIADDSGVIITGYRICGVPRKSYYVAHPLDTESSSTDTQTTRAEDAALPANASDWTDSGLISLSDVTSFDTSFYLYENRAGVNTAITAQNQKVKANAPDSAAYVMIYGMAPGYTSLSWKIYLGANNTTNFNIKRNCTYACTVTLKPNDSDVRIKSNKLIWAGSNIYWDGSKLTFDTESTDANNRKQGVCFQWGSLIGISLSDTYVTYTPTYNSGTPLNSTWTQGETTWDVFYHTGTSSDYGQTNTFLNDAAQNTDANYIAYKGDICQYLSKTQPSLGSWRMPTAKEYNAGGVADKTYVSWSTSTTPWAYFGIFDDQASNVNAQGTFALSSGGTYTVNGSSSSYPASGYRSTSGALLRVGQFGLYWSSSADTDSANGYVLYFSSSHVYPAVGSNRQYGYLVRCVQN